MTDSSKSIRFMWLKNFQKYESNLFRLKVKLYILVSVSFSKLSSLVNFCFFIENILTSAKFEGLGAQV